MSASPASNWTEQQWRGACSGVSVPLNFTHSPATLDPFNPHAPPPACFPSASASMACNGNGGCRTERKDSLAQSFT